jgi:hypothetical protein
MHLLRHIVSERGIMMQSEDSPLRTYVNDLKAWDIDLMCTDEA